MIPRLQRALLALFALLACLHTTVLATSNSSSTTQYVTYQQPDGTTVYLKNDRRPALYTGNYGDCLGTSLINFTRFDAAYYQDNMTVLFHIEGNTAVQNESLVLYISVFAYGETRLTFLFNPCSANIPSLCPLNSSVPITAQGIIPVAPSDVAAVPSLAFSIPDFEGQAVLRVFANSTQSEIGCYSAVLTNGKSFSQPSSAGTVLGVLAAITMLASFATAIYGAAVPTMRLHYAHSLSTGVVMAVFQHIFFTGALSMNWPSVLVAWWSNFAWAGGMIHSSKMQAAINKLVGNNIGSTAEVGAAPSDSTQNSVGGTPDISEIYKRGLAGLDFGLEHSRRALEQTIARRANKAPLDGYTWYGHPVGADLPLPGNYSGFAGTLAEENIPVSNAFMTGFLWFLILLVLVVAAVVVFKWFVEFLGLIRLVKKDRLRYFRDHWLGYAGVVALRTCYLAWFVIMFLTIFEFTFSSSGGVKAVAGVVFAVWLLGIGGAAVYACVYKAKTVGHEQQPPSQVQRKRLLGFIAWRSPRQVEDNAAGADAQPFQPDEKTGSVPAWKRTDSTRSAGEPDNEQQQGENLHDNEAYTTRFGWLASRFRRTKWWFFAAWLVYEFLRACFYGGASGKPLAQVFGLLVIEILAFAFIIWARPFEGRRLNVLVVYCLGFSKVASVALSAAFDTQFNLDRITTTVIGIVIIVIQGVLTIITMIAVLVGAMSSYMSISRNHDDFRPRRLANTRERYFNHLDRVVDDVPREKVVPPREPTPEPAEPEVPREPYFEMRGIRRVAKIEDEDEEFAAEIHSPQGDGANDFKAASTTSFAKQKQQQQSSSGGHPDAIGVAVPTPTDAPAGTGAAVASSSRSRSASVRSLGNSNSNLPFGARQHRPSWSSRDFAAGAGTSGEYYAPAFDGNPSTITRGVSGGSANANNNDDTFVPVNAPQTTSQPSSPSKVQHQHTRSRSQGRRLSRSKYARGRAEQEQMSRQYEEYEDLPSHPPPPVPSQSVQRAQTASPAHSMSGRASPATAAAAGARTSQQKQQNLSRHPSAASSLRVGGEVSTSDTIGPVPVPPVLRPRARSTGPGSQGGGSAGSRRTSHENFSRLQQQQQQHDEGDDWGDLMEFGPASGAASPRRSASRPRPLTPALELDEWAVPPVPSARDER